MQNWKIYLALSILLFMAGCSDKPSAQTQAKTENDHIWKEQTKALDQAKEVETLIMESAQQRQEQIDQQAR